VSAAFEPGTPGGPDDPDGAHDPHDPVDPDAAGARYDPSAEARQKLMRQASLYMYGYIAAAVFVAIAGAALVAFLLRGTGWPFFRTWAILVAVMLVPPALAAVVRAVRSPGG
jgi:hypothetical protein